MEQFQQEKYGCIRLKEATKYKVNNYPECNSRYNSLIDALNSIRVNSSFENRKIIAQKNNVRDYIGTTIQNKQLLDKLKAGRLKK